MWSLRWIKVLIVWIQLVLVPKCRQESTTKFYSSNGGAENRKKIKGNAKLWRKNSQNKLVGPQVGVFAGMFCCGRYCTKKHSGLLE